jgi:hypothetical protein
MSEDPTALRRDDLRAGVPKLVDHRDDGGARPVEHPCGVLPGKRLFTK